jgi:hypothetical protein
MVIDWVLCHAKVLIVRFLKNDFCHFLNNVPTTFVAKGGRYFAFVWANIPGKMVVLNHFLCCKCLKISK